MHWHSSRATWHNWWMHCTYCLYRLMMWPGQVTSYELRCKDMPIFSLAYQYIFGLFDSLSFYKIVDQPDIRISPSFWFLQFSNHTHFPDSYSRPMNQEIKSVLCEALDMTEITIKRLSTLFAILQLFSYRNSKKSILLKTLHCIVSQVDGYRAIEREIEEQRDAWPQWLNIHLKFTISYKLQTFPRNPL